MNLSLIIFYVLGAMVGLSAIFVALTKNVIYAAFALILCFLCLSGVYVFLGAEFIAIVQILVYVGGILVLLLFGVMLTNRLKGQDLLTATRSKFFGFLLAVALFLVLVKGIISANFVDAEWMQQEVSMKVGLKGFGLNLMTEYVLAFELIGLLLLVALIGSVYIAGKGKEAVDAD